MKSYLLQCVLKHKQFQHKKKSVMRCDFRQDDTKRCLDEKHKIAKKILSVEEEQGSAAKFILRKKDCDTALINHLLVN